MANEINNSRMATEMQMLDCMSRIYEKKDNLFKNLPVLSGLSNEVRVVSGFFRLEAKTAVALSVILCNQLMGESTSLQRVLKSLGLCLADHIRVNNAFIDFRKIGWMRICPGRDFMDEGIEYEFIQEVIDAVMNDDASKLDIPAPKDLSEALLKIHGLILNVQDVLDREDHRQELLIVLERYIVFPLIGKLIGDDHLSPLEKLMLLYLSAESLFGRDEFNLNEILEMFSNGRRDALCMAKMIREGTMSILRDGYIKFANPGLADFAAVSLGDVILKEIDGNSLLKRERSLRLRICELVQPAEIAPQALCFNPEVHSAVKDILTFTAPENYASLQEKLTAANMTPGLTMMFYGPPGTGKTELVRQIAREHNMSVLQVDIAGIKNMWVGESEKNVNRVFEEYQSAMDHFENTPILLFNEADGILGVRKSVRGSVDQMLNAMQNILLQKLESFTGIFIATTNLTTNIDGAFDRRMLYKLRFDLPDEATRFKILKNAFPSFTDELLRGISREYALSGGQIQNIRKKFVVDEILYGNRKDQEEAIFRYLEEETRFRTGTKKAIGYKLKS